MTADDPNEPSANEPLPAAVADIVRHLTAEELGFLDRCYDSCLGTDRADPSGARPRNTYLGSASALFFLVTGEHAQFGTGVDLFELADGMIGHAKSLGLIEGSYAIPGTRGSGLDEFHMTRLGFDVVRACRAAGKMGK